MRKSVLRRIAKAVALRVRAPAKIFLGLFFDRSVLSGRHFEEGLAGYVWALSAIWQRNILRLGRPMPFPASAKTHISNPHNIDFHPDDLNNFQSPGTYLQNFNGHIVIGRGSYIGPNVGIITANHDLLNLDNHETSKAVVLGTKCWIGMNSVLLPGVVLGNRTIVGAGSVVTKAFPDGDCVIAGNPAKLIRKIEVR